jgi:formylglycine-generating enzyme required for sulfatase activity
MAGNVWQWVQDCYEHNYNGAPVDGSAWTVDDCEYRVVRGGAWVLDPQSFRSALRNRDSLDDRLNYLGFRVGRTLLVP